MTSAPAPANDAYAYIGRNIIQDHVNARKQRAALTADVPPPAKTASFTPTKPSSTYPVGILGAGKFTSSIS